MTRIDFYVLGDEEHDTRLQLVCKLIEKAAATMQKVFVYSADEDALAELDERLWNFRAVSFVAHRMLARDYITGLADNDPVLLSAGEPGNDRSILVNLDLAVPAFFSRFDRTLEIVNRQAHVQEAGRDRYRFYQQRGYPLHHHNIDA